MKDFGSQLSVMDRRDALPFAAAASSS